MKQTKTLLLFVIAVSVIFSACTDRASKNETAPPVSADGVFSKSFDSFKRDYDSKTHEQQNEYWKTIAGKKVQWGGTVHDAFTASDKTRHVIVNTGASSFVAFILAQDETTDILGLNKGDKISFAGVLSEQGDVLKSWIVADARAVK